MNRQSMLHELVCWLTKKVLSAHSPVGSNKKHNIELWYNIGIHLADRQKSKRGPAVEKHCPTQLHHCHVSFHIVLLGKIVFVLGAVQVITSEEIIIDGATGEHSYVFTGFEVWSYTVMDHDSCGKDVQ